MASHMETDKSYEGSSKNIDTLTDVDASKPNSHANSNNSGISSDVLVI
jgi:hypothetical protein